jgi:excisionase family DNA binding protein
MPNVITAVTAEALAADKEQHVPQSHRTALSRTAAPTTPSNRDAYTAPGVPSRRQFVPFETRWDAKDVAAYLNCSESWVYKNAEKGSLPCVRYGGLLRFDPEAIRRHGTRAPA